MNILSEGSSDPLFPRGPGLAIKALALVVFSVGLMVYDSRGSTLLPLRDLLGRILTPIVWVGATPRHMGELGEYARSRRSLLEENVQLRERQLELDGRLQRFEALNAENRRLRALLSSSETLPDRVLVAEIIEISQDPYRQQIVLDKGATDGVFKGQALLDAYGVMGQVIEVQHGRSVALLVTDAQHGLPVEIVRTGLQTIAQGEGDGQSLRLPFLPGNADVRDGDLIVSSPLGGRFPAGYPVGQVAEIRHRAGDLFKQALAVPTAHLNQGRLVLLVQAVNPGPKEAPEGLAAPVPAPAESGP